MAKNIITCTFELENNDGLMNERETKLYAETYMAEALKDWDKVKIEICQQERGGSETRKSSFSQSRENLTAQSLNPIRSRYPWHCSADELPEDDEPHAGDELMVCEWVESKVWHDHWSEPRACYYDEERNEFITKEEEMGADFIKPSPLVYWRIVSAPDFDPTKK